MIAKFLVLNFASLFLHGIIKLCNLFLTAGDPVGGSLFGYSNNGIVLEDVRCTSFESSLEGCSRSPFNNFTQSQCLNAATNSAGVACIISGKPYACIIAEVWLLTLGACTRGLL